LPPKEQRDEGEGQGPSTPPPVRRNFKRTEEEDDDEVWYSKLWMFGFADSFQDSFQDLVPKH
jgi:hypothetical protein